MLITLVLYFFVNSTLTSANSFPCHTCEIRSRKSFACHTSEKRVCKSFSCHTFFKFNVAFHRVRALLGARQNIGTLASRLIHHRHHVIGNMRPMPPVAQPSGCERVPTRSGWIVSPQLTGSAFFARHSPHATRHFLPRSAIMALILST